MKNKLFSILLILILLAVTLPVPATDVSLASKDLGPLFASDTEDAKHPLGIMQREAMSLALKAKLNGKVQSSQKIYKTGRTYNRIKYVELAREGEDTIWTIIAEFGDLIHPVTQGAPGPVHNQIPAPDRVVDNTTIWVADFNKTYFENILFSEVPNVVSMRNYYIEQSSNRYTVNGEVTDWVKVPYNEARYGTNICGSIVCSTVWDLVRDGAAVWYNNQIAAGKTPEEINAYLAQFDVRDRYDYDGDGNFNEPDGYIDHFQIVHAGKGEETGGGAQGKDAIWSHRWYAYYNLVGSSGPAFNKLGGTQVGDSNYWIGDYTVEPENGGVGVFAHEYGHDLGLPDLYDTSGNTGGAENSTGFWTLYSSGSYGSTGQPTEGIGSKPTHMSAYEKIFLDWSNYAITNYDEKATLKLGPAEYNTKDYQQLIVLLPDKQVDSFIGVPFSGSYFYHSGAGNDLDNSMMREVTLPAAPVSLTAKVRYRIEPDFDYAYLTINGDPIATNLSSETNPNGQNFGHGITGSSSDNWVDLTADLSAYAGQTVIFGFRYWTDGAVAEAGFGVDDISITGLPTNDAETEPGWDYVGFIRTDGTLIQSFANFYIAEFRQYVGYDTSLRTGPYNLGFLNTKPNWVEHFPYQNGLLVWYLDYSFADNNVGDNCAVGHCGGFFLPVDAHPELLIRPDNGKVWRPRVQSYDSTFSTLATDKICLHMGTTFEQCYGELKGNPLFDDTQRYWVEPNPAINHYGWASVPLPSVGVTIRVAQMTDRPGMPMTVQVNK